LDSHCLNLLRDFQGVGDVTPLRLLVTARQQDNDFGPALYKIDTISGAVIDPHLSDAVKIFGVAKVAEAEATNSDRDTILCAIIP
jgi:hypothetical protein